MLILSDVGIKNLTTCISDISGNENIIKYWDIVNSNEVSHSCCECNKKQNIQK